MRRPPFNFIFLLASLINLSISSCLRLDEISTPRNDQINQQNHGAGDAPRSVSSLECLLFDNTGCKITCDVKSLLYGCTTTASCDTNDFCDCRETYVVDQRTLDYAAFQRLSFEDAWNYKFVDDAASRLIRRLIQQDPRTSAAIAPIVRDPHISGVLLLRKFKRVFPEADMLDSLRPSQRGNLHLFVYPNWRFDFAAFSVFLDNYTIVRSEDLQDIRVREQINLPRDEDSIMNMARGLLLFPNDFTRNAVQNFLQTSNITYERLANVTDIQGYTNPDSDRELSAEQIDEIVCAGIFSKLTDIASDSDWYR